MRPCARACRPASFEEAIGLYERVLAAAPAEARKQRDVNPKDPNKMICRTEEVIGQALQMRGPVVVEVDMSAWGEFPVKFAGPPKKTA